MATLRPWPEHGLTRSLHYTEAMETPDQTVDDAAAPEPAAAPAVAAEGVAETEEADLATSEPEEADLATSESEPQADVIDLTDSATEASPDVSADAPTSDAPTVDVLEDQLGQLQGAMDKLQAGDLDGAEQTIKALEDKMSSLRN